MGKTTLFQVASCRPLNSRKTPWRRPIEESTEPKLTADFLERRPGALEAICQAYAVNFFSTARSILGSDDEALDCVHDALLQAWRHADEYRPERGPLLSYLLTYVSNEAKLYQKNSPEQQHSSAQLGATMTSEQNEALECLCRRISVSVQGAETLPTSGWIEQIKQDFSAAAPWVVGGTLLLALGTLSIGDVKIQGPMSRNDTTLSTIAHRHFLQKPLTPHAPGALNGEAIYDPDGH